MKSVHVTALVERLGDRMEKGREIRPGVGEVAAPTVPCPPQTPRLRARTLVDHLRSAISALGPGNPERVPPRLVVPGTTRQTVVLCRDIHAALPMAHDAAHRKRRLLRQEGGPGAHPVMAPQRGNKVTGQRGAEKPLRPLDVVPCRRGIEQREIGRRVDRKPAIDPAPGFRRGHIPQCHEDILPQACDETDPGSTPTKRVQRLPPGQAALPPGSGRAGRPRRRQQFGGQRGTSVQDPAARAA